MTMASIRLVQMVELTGQKNHYYSNTVRVSASMYTAKYNASQSVGQWTIFSVPAPRAGNLHLYALYK